MGIGIIGFGRFGKFAAGLLARDCEVHVNSRKRMDKDAKEVQALGAKPATLKEACSQEIVVLCVPVSEFEDVLGNIKGMLREDSVVIDVCAVKVYTTELMRKILPKNVHILATHPIFGPDSAKESLKGKNIALCKVRINDEQYGKIKKYLAGKGLNIIETTPEEHDRQIAMSLFLTHLIGRSLLEMKAEKVEMGNSGYQILMSILETVEHDKWQLFEDMFRYNAHAQAIRKKFTDAVHGVNRRLGQ